MNIHNFSVILADINGTPHYYTGSLRRHRFPRLRRLLHLPLVSPYLSTDQHDAEFHLSPSETHESLTRLRMQYPDYRWYYGEVALTDYINEAMTPHFCIVVRNHISEQWYYYYDGAFDNDRHLALSRSMSCAKWLNIDEIKTTCQALNINHKNYHYHAIACPSFELNAADIPAYLADHPVHSMYATFHLPRR